MKHTTYLFDFDGTLVDSMPTFVSVMLLGRLKQIRIYIMAAEKIGKPIKEILFLDDSFNADKTAKQAGMSVCGVYDLSSEDYISDIKSVSDYYIYDFAELLEL